MYLEREDYYIENGLLVFTAAYHLKRGTCCESGCRHCPWSEERDRKAAERQEAATKKMLPADESRGDVCGGKHGRE